MRKKIMVFVLAMVLFCSTTFAEDGHFPQVSNVTLTVANTEYSQAVSGAQKFTIQCRTNFAVRLAYVTGKVATPTEPYLTIKAGSVYWEDNISLAGRTLYFASSEAGVIIEIIYFK